MFLFESSKEKAIRQDVEKSMETCISNPKKYNEAKEILAVHLRGSDQKIIEMIVDNIKSTIKNEDYQPVRKYQAMLLLKDLMLTHNKALGKYVVKKVLKRLTILAQHKSGAKDLEREQERARDIFGSVKKDQEQYAVKFFNALLTALQQWGKNWPKAPDGPYKDFHRQYNDLLMNGVQFPKERPKELTKSVTGVTGGRMSREQSKIPPEPASPPKPKPKQKEDKKQVAQPLPQRQSKISPNIVNSLDQYFDGVKEAVMLLNQLLPAFAPDEVPVIVDIAGQIQKTVQAGNELVISIGGDPTYQNDSLKIEKCFDLVTKIQKDLRILTKKPQQLDVFKSKYAKLINQLVTTLAKSRTSSSISPIKQEDKSTRSKVDPSPQFKRERERERQEPTPQPEVKVQQKPKITPQNRYVSVHGNQVLQNFAKNVDYHSNSGQSVHSDRFGSFGGPTNADKHKITVPNRVSGGSPQVDQGNKKANTDRRQLSVDEVSKSITAIPEQKSVSISKKQLQSGNFPKQSSNMQQPQLASQKLFKQFQPQKKMPEKGSVKNGEGKFEDNSSFGPNNFGKNKSQGLQQEDFFAKVEQNAKQLNKDIVQARRKKNVPKQDNEDFFKVRMESQIDSSKLSGFEFAKGVQGSKIESKNVQNIPEKPQETGSKKEAFPDNPFGLDTSQNQSKNFGNQSNFFDPFEKGSDIFGKSTVTYKVKTETNENQANPRQQNPFATGNFGNIVQKNMASANPFDNQSMRSKKQRQNNSVVNDNPFGNSFEKSSKASKPARHSVNSHNQNKGNLNNSALNPFQSRGYNPNDNFFEQRINNSRNNENPFQTQTQRTSKSKNPFEQVQQFYKPPSHHMIEGLSQRNSFKDIQIGQRNEIVGGNLGVSGFPEPLRDSLMFTTKLDKEASQYGLNFSQFPDIGGPETQEHKQQPRGSDPFNTSSKKQEPQFSGFSLSNFPGIGQQENQKQNPVGNSSAADFFANFQKESIKSKKSQEKAQPMKKSLKEQKQKNIFEDFFANNSFSNQSKSQKRKSNKNQNTNHPNNYVYERQKTVLSGEQKSFDFANLDKASAIQKKGKSKNDFDAFTEGGKQQNVTKRQQKQGFVIDNKSQKSLSWGDFSARPDEVVDKRQDRSEKGSNEAKSNNLLQVQSRINIVEQLKEGESKQPTSRVNRFSNQPSLDLQIEDFAPVVKKGIQWNPLNKITILKKSPYTYNVDDKKIEQKKKELQQKQRQYGQKLQMFKFARHKNDQIRNMLMQKMKKVQDIMHQKTQYEQILKKLKETNCIKESQIEQLYTQIKMTQALKVKILQKEKQLYQLTKNQIYLEQKKAPAQRSMASKWQMFNKNLQHNRNSLLTMHSQYTNGF